MLNIKRIRKLSAEELAPMLVYQTVSPDYSFGQYLGCDTVYMSPDGEKFYDYEDAVEYTIEWLLSEFVIV